MKVSSKHQEFIKALITNTQNIRKKNRTILTNNVSNNQNKRTSSPSSLKGKNINKIG
jgi:hypothetical protein